MKNTGLYVWKENNGEQISMYKALFDDSTTAKRFIDSVANNADELHYNIITNGKTVYTTEKEGR